MDTYRDEKVFLVRNGPGESRQLRDAN